MKEKEIYLHPEIVVVRCQNDIITYSETEEWEGPLVQAGEEGPEN